MFIVNSESIKNEKKFPCKSNKLKRFLVEMKGIPYVSRIADENTNKITWYFIKTDLLDLALKEWEENKKSGNLVFPKND